MLAFDDVLESGLTCWERLNWTLRTDRQDLGKRLLDFFFLQGLSSPTDNFFLRHRIFFSRFGDHVRILDLIQRRLLGLLHPNLLYSIMQQIRQLFTLCNFI